MFVSIGSSCNACIEPNPLRASIIRCRTDGSDCKVYASGLRNSVDFGLYFGQIFATEAGKSFIGNNLPPEEINLILDGKNYGRPYCYGNKVHDITFDRLNNPCPDTLGGFAELPAHSTPPLGSVTTIVTVFVQNFLINFLLPCTDRTKENQLPATK